MISNDLLTGEIQVLFPVCAASGLGITFLAPFCPELNGVEWGIGWVKHQVLDDEAASQTNLVQAVHLGCQKMPASVAAGFIRAAGY